MRELYNLSELYSEYGSSGLDAVAPQQLLSKLTRDPSASDSERDVELSDHSAAVSTLGRKSSSEREGDADNSEADLAQQLDDTGSGTRRRSKLRGPKSRCKANSNLVLSEDWGGERLVAAEGGREQELESSPVINVVVNLKPRRMSLNHSVEDVHRTCSDERQGRWTGGSTCDQSPYSKIANNSCAETSVVENYNGKTNKPEYAKTVNESPDQISVSYGEAIKIEDEISYRSSRTRQDNEDWTSDQPCSKISGRALPKSSDTRAVGDQASLCNKSTGFETSTNDVFNSEKCKTASQITNARILNQKQKRTSAVNSFNSLGEEVQCNDDEVQSLRRAADDCNASVKEAISKRDYSSGSQLSGFDERLTSSSGTSEIQCKSMQRNSTLQNSDDFNSTPSDSDQRAVVKNSVPSEGRARLLSLKRRKVINCNGASEGKEGEFSVVADDEDFETKTNMKLSSCVREYQRCIEKSIERHCRGESERNLENSGVQFTLANHTDVGSLPRKSAKPHRSSVNKRAASLCVTADEDSEEEEVQLTVPIVSITM